LLPTLRLAFMVVPPSLREVAHKAKFVTDWHTATIAQHALARFIDEGADCRRIAAIAPLLR
jgi:GntR family transcriptional regulator/MocR family aminotransferase